MNTKQLRQKILDLAIRGKLVPQDPADEPASVLLERVRVEKERLIKEGKIKRDKKDNAIVRSADKPHYGKLPFEVPESWEWCRLDDIGTTNIGLTYKPTDVCSNGIPVLRANNIQNRKLEFSDLVRVNTPFGKALELQENDILICTRNGSRRLVGKCALIPANIEKMTFGAFMAVYRSIYNQYVYHFLNADFFRQIFESEGISTQINQLTQVMIKDTLIPLPPLAEQYRIVATIESTFAVIDEIEQNKKDLQVAVAVTKSKILSLAVRGKLVPQDPADESAGVLLERIRAERELLIKTGKIRRGKAGSAAIRGGDSSYYGNLSDGWIAVPIEWLFSVVGGGTPSTNRTEYWGNGIPWFSSADIDDNGIITPRRHVTQLGLDNSTTNVVPKGSVVAVTRVGLGKVAILDCDMCFSQDNQALIPHYPDVIDNCYLYYFLFHEMQTLKEFGRGTTIAGITKKQLIDIILLLPPIVEQWRIVDIIKSTYKHLDKITDNLI